MTYIPRFPAALQPIASALLRALPVESTQLAANEFTVLVQGEQLSVPYRIYHAPDSLRSVISSSSGETQVLALCFGTRHWDGYFREECVRQLVAIDRPWVVPFIVQLVGEYVIEIVEVIATALPQVNPLQFSEFVRENPRFMATTKRRVTSYWDCYHRRRFPTLQSYPAFKVLEAIERMGRAA